jgi:uncharacterized membrane protein YdjX (TVP38/TMEM64 family)
MTAPAELPVAPGAVSGSVFSRRIASSQWDRLLWTTAAVALAGILLSSFVPWISEITVFVSLTLLTNGPYSALLPTAYEPMLMVFARFYPPLLLALLGTAGEVAVEVVNYRIFSAAVHWQRLERARSSPLVRRLVAWFEIQPFLTTAFCALTPIPFWVARVCATLSRYSLPRYLLGTAAGRLPRLWFYAALGTVIPLNNGFLLTVSVLGTVLLLGGATLRRAIATRG